MDHNHNIRFITIVALLVAILGTMITFSSMSYAIDDSDEANWNVQITNLSEPIIKGNAVVIAKPRVSSTYLDNYTVNLLNYGDTVTYNFDVKNEGNIDAVLDTFSLVKPKCTLLSNGVSGDNVCQNNIQYTLSYTDTQAVPTSGDRLVQGTNSNFTLTMTYLPDLNNIDSMGLQVKDLGIVLMYSQDK